MIGPVGDFALFGAVIHGSTAAAISKFPFELRGRTKLTFPTLHRAEVFTESAFCADFVPGVLSKRNDIHLFAKLPGSVFDRLSVLRLFFIRLT